MTNPNNYQAAGGDLIGSFPNPTVSSIGGVAASNFPNTIKTLGFTGGVIINGLGDSIIAQSVYQPYGAGKSSTYSFAGAGYSPVAPAWVTATVYPNDSVVQNGGVIYYCPTGGTSGATAPTGITTSSDGNITWSALNPIAGKWNTSFLFWAEAFANGQLNFDLAQGYSGTGYGLLKIIVTNGGSGYSNGDTVTLSGGAKATLTIAGGVITSVTVTNPGYTNPINLTSINTSTGSGAVLSMVSCPSGTFGVSGCTTIDMVARLPDCVASAVDIFVVAGGTNDIFDNTISFATITGNLKLCCETLLAAGKRVILATLIPRSQGMTALQITLYIRVNNWIREYVRKAQAANPLAVTIALTDPVGYLTDGTSTGNLPIGSNSGSQRCMTIDGIHPSPRGAMYMGLCTWQAVQPLLQGLSPNYPARIYSQADGYDINNNPGGNLLEGLPWQASTAYVVGQNVSNDTSPLKTYTCITAGTSAASGGPTGTGASITDGTATWQYQNPAGMSVFNSGTNGNQVAATGITYSGNLAGGYTISRANGSASGTVACAIESPWSNGQNGQRQAITFSLGGGTNAEQWSIRTSAKLFGVYGILASDINTSAFYAECELEISSVANLNQLQVDFFATGIAGTQNGSISGMCQLGTLNATTAYGHMNSNGEMLPIPANGKFFIRTQPLIISSAITSQSLAPHILLGFDASGAAASATAQVKLNYLAIKKAYSL